jgi:hypothetical protein
VFDGGCGGCGGGCYGGCGQPMMTPGCMGGGCSSCGGVPGPASGPAPVGPAPNVTPSPAPGQSGAQLSVPPTTMYNPAPMMQVTPTTMMDARNTMAMPARY